MTDTSPVAARKSLRPPAPPCLRWVGIDPDLSLLRKVLTRMQRISLVRRLSPGAVEQAYLCVRAFGLPFAQAGVLPEEEWQRLPSGLVMVMQAARLTRSNIVCLLECVPCGEGAPPPRVMSEDSWTHLEEWGRELAAIFWRGDWRLAGPFIGRHAEELRITQEAMWSRPDWGRTQSFLTRLAALADPSAEPAREPQEASSNPSCDSAFDDMLRDQTVHGPLPRVEASLTSASLRRRLEPLLGLGSPHFVSELEYWLRRIGDEWEAEGRMQVRWRDFQRRWPSIAARHAQPLQALFHPRGVAATSALRGFVASRQPYSLKLSVWTGWQRIFPAHQLVVQIGSRLLLHAPTHTTDRLAELQIRHRLCTAAIEDLHPTGPDTVGWLRVHVDTRHRTLFVDEVQSDVLELLRRLAAQDEQPQAAALRAEFSDWHFHGFATLLHWARGCGWRVALHSRESARCVSGMTLSERKWGTTLSCVASGWCVADCRAIRQKSSCPRLPGSSGHSLSAGGTRIVVLDTSRRMPAPSLHAAIAPRLRRTSCGHRRPGPLGRRTAGRQRRDHPDDRAA